MAYQDEIIKTQMLPFAELYQIKVKGSFAGGNRLDLRSRNGEFATYFYYTSFHEDIAFDNNDYLTRPIHRGEFTLSDRLRAIRVKVAFPLSAPAVEYICGSPPLATEVKILRKFIPGDDAVQLFYGSLISVAIENNIANVDLESETRLLRNKVPPFLFQAFCNHALFDPRCRLSALVYEVSAIVSSVSGSNIIAPQFATRPDGYLNMGSVSFASDVRLITRHVGNTITVQFPFSSLPNNALVHAVPGCDKSYETCLNKFNNIENRLGFDNIPSSNPCIFGFK